MSTFVEILDAAMMLPPQERAELADVLLASTEIADTEPAISDAWREEIARRSAEYERGEVAGRRWDEIRNEIKQKYEPILPVELFGRFEC